MKQGILLLGLLVGVAMAAETGAELYQKAVVQERAAGNLEEAIKPISASPKSSHRTARSRPRRWYRLRGAMRSSDRPKP